MEELKCRIRARARARPLASSLIYTNSDLIASDLVENETEMTTH